MRYERFALFDSAVAADSALRDLSARSELQGCCSVVVHRDRIDGELTDPDLARDEWGTRAGTRFGAIVGALLAGALLAFMESNFRIFGAGPMSAAIAGACVGGLIGGLIGAVVGSAYGDPNLEELAVHLKKGRVLASVNVKGLTRLQEVEYLFRSHQAQVKRRAVF